MAEASSEDLRKLVADVAAAYFASSHVSASDIPSVIDQIASSLRAVSGSEPAPPSEEAVTARKLTPQQIRKSIRPEALISFEDGKGYKTLRRHLSVKGLTPQQYREKWGLPKDYPLVAQSYSEARSQLAKALGLGSRAGAIRAKGKGGKGGRRAPSAPPPVME